MKWIKKVAATPLTTIARVVDSLQTQTNDRTNAPSIRAVNDAIANKWETIYPIGSIYMSVNSTNPSTVFGGTWQPIKDKFLLASGDNYTNGEEGGTASNTLDVSQLPSHDHSYTRATGVGNHTLTTTEIPTHAHSIPSLSGTAQLGGAHMHTYYTPNFQQSNASQGSYGSTSDETWKSNKTGNYDGSGANEGAHSHSVTTNSSTTGESGSNGAHNHPLNTDTANTSSVGSGASINNMPPYLAVNVWVRTS